VFIDQVHLMACLAQTPLAGSCCCSTSGKAACTSEKASVVLVLAGRQSRPSQISPMCISQTLQVVAASPTDYRMFYHSWDGARRRYVVGFATSSDALRWRKQGPIFEGGQSESDHDAKVGSRSFAPFNFEGEPSTI